jgi:hypothetical protein
MATVWNWEKVRCVPPIAPGHRLHALAVAAPYIGGNLLKYLVKRATHADIVAFLEDASIRPAADL